jgi:hypothetical protein
MDGLGFGSRYGQEIFLLKFLPGHLWGPPSNAVQLLPGHLWGPPSNAVNGAGLSVAELKRSVREADHSRPSSSEVKNEWSCTCVFTAWRPALPSCCQCRQLTVVCQSCYSVLSRHFRPALDVADNRRSVNGKPIDSRAFSISSPVVTICTSCCKSTAVCSSLVVLSSCGQLVYRVYISQVVILGMWRRTVWYRRQSHRISTRADRFNGTATEL